MKNFFISFCLILTLLNFVTGQEHRPGGFSSSLQNTASGRNFVVKKDFPNIFLRVGSFFKHIFRKRGEIYEPAPANVLALYITSNDITASCSRAAKSCSKVQTVEIETIARDPENDVLNYKYNVSAGKIIGKGAKVTWDLSGIAPGTYTITAGVEDGCGVCGQTRTQTVKVIECLECE